MRPQIIACLLFLAIFTRMSFADEIEPHLHPTAGAEIVIVPLRVGITAGAHGSIWSVEGSVYNSSAFPVRLTFGTCLADQTPDCIVDLAPGKTIPMPQPINDPFSYNAVVIRNDDANHPPGATPRDIWFQLRARDVTRQSESAGTEIAIVREGRLLDRTVSLLDIPIDPRFRANLRIYTHPLSRYDPKEGGPRFEVRVFRNEALVEKRTVIVPYRVLPLIYHGEWAEEILITDLFERVDCGTCRVRVEIQPLDLEARYWAFVSITNDATSQITTISPQ